MAVSADQAMAGMQGRIDWVDHAKGLSILLVVMMHATLGVEAAAGATGWMHPLVEFAKPFRMPAFFLVCGLFLARSIDGPWRNFLDRKVVHFLYFYVLWLTIQFAFKAPAMAVEGGASAAIGAYLMAFVQPFGTLWFIYALPVFFLVTRLLRGLPAWLVLGWAAIVQIMPIATGSVIIDEFCARYVFFFAGYVLAPRVFSFSQWTSRNLAFTLAGLALWAPVNGFLALTAAQPWLAPYAQIFVWDTGVTRLSDIAGLSLLAGAAGSAAVVAAATFFARAAGFDWLRWIGQHSIVIYLAFFLPMAVTRTVLLKLGIISDIGMMSLITWLAAVIGPIVLHFLIQRTGVGGFLFERPGWARIEGGTRDRRSAERLVPGE